MHSLTQPAPVTCACLSVWSCQACHLENSALQSACLDEVAFKGNAGSVDGFVEIAPLMSPSGVEDLQLSQCAGLGYERAAWLGWHHLHPGKACHGFQVFRACAPNSSQVLMLQGVCLRSPTSCTILVDPPELTAMQCFRASDIVAVDFGDGCMKFIDISTLAHLSPRPAIVRITGVVCARTSCCNAQPSGISSGFAMLDESRGSIMALLRALRPCIARQAPEKPICSQHAPSTRQLENDIRN